MTAPNSNTVSVGLNCIWFIVKARDSVDLDLSILGTPRRVEEEQPACAVHAPRSGCEEKGYGHQYGGMRLQQSVGVHGSVFPSRARMAADAVELGRPVVVLGPRRRAARP